MNIFYLDRDPKIAAQLMCDKHVVKMILESAQMLSTAHRVLDGDEYANETGMYKMAHKNHPSTIWVRSSFDNYVWLWEHMTALMREYTHRYGKHHATERLKECLARAPTNIPFGVKFTDPPQCMPETCKGEDTVLAYQNYYIVEKSDFAKWTKREVPAWFLGETDAKGKSRQLYITENA
tara:strand:- start:1867 stop:2403 length:537 start_codon:yes stop_codon:yes gene_type:complete